MATIITISRAGGSVTFSPSPVTIPVNSSVVFANADPQSQHLPTLAGKGENFWFTHPLAPAFPGRPNDTSDEVFFGTAGQVHYVCALHSGEEGFITIQ
jgi:plastocyanin